MQHEIRRGAIIFSGPAYYEEGDPKCLCGFCRLPIPAETADGEDNVAIRLFSPCGNYSAALHDECLSLLVDSGDLTLQHPAASHS